MQQDSIPLVSVIIVNWNGRDWLETCLPTLAAQTFRDFEVVVVDNGSTDGSIDWLKKEWPQVRVLPQAENLGFAVGNNCGIQASSGPYIVTLNNDTRLDAEFLAEMVTAVETSSLPKTGMVAAQIVRWQQPDLLDSAGIEVDWAGIAWNRGWQQPVATANQLCEVFGPSGAAALYRRDMLDDISLFDADFFCYYEDVDLAWRGQRAGWTCLYAPKARVHHWHSATAVSVPAFKTTMLGRNKMWTIVKNYAWPAFIWALPLIIVYDAAAILKSFWQTRSLAALRGRCAALRKLWVMRAKRVPAQKVVALQRPYPFKQRTM